MILGIGIDMIEIHRFALWHTYLPKKLLRIFSIDEIKYCLENKNKSAERFAARFAAREALYKALCAVYPNTIPAFLTICTSVTIKKINSQPILELHNKCGIDTNSCTIHLSLTHSRSHAAAFVIIESK